MQLPRAALVALVLPHAAALAVRPKLTALRPGPNLRPPARVDPTEPPGPRDVVIKLYDISTPELCKAMSLLASKPAYWFPKLSVGVGRRTWSYDGEPEQTYDAIIQNAAGGPPLRTWNCGATALSDAEIDAEIDEVLADYGYKIDRLGALAYLDGTVVSDSEDEEPTGSDAKSAALG